MNEIQYPPPEEIVKRPHGIDLECRMKLIQIGSNCHRVLISFSLLKPPLIWIAQHLDRDCRFCAKLECREAGSSSGMSIISLWRLGRLKQMDSEFAVDPSSASSMVIVLTKALWVGFVCWNVRWRSDLVRSDFFPFRRISSYRTGVRILFHSRETRQHAASVLCTTDWF